jgi:hypothetical protein
VLFSYLFCLNVAGIPLEEARTAATTVLIAVGLYLVVALEAAPGTRRAWVVALVGSLTLAYLIVLAVSGLRHFFELETLGGWGLLGTVGGVAAAIAGLLLTDERFLPGRATA